MSYFIPLSIQKRLLRYALSRLELLDTDALDLDKLNIGWGRKSVVELHDVGIRKTKLVSLLQLPDQICLDSAAVASLRLTIPSDLHTSSIIVEVSGVEVSLSIHKVDLDKADQEDYPDIRNSTRRSSVSSTSQSNTRRNRDEFPSFSSDEEDDVLPTPHNLATSYMAEGPIEEREQLEAALASQSVELRQSFSSSGSGEEELKTGLGVGIGLPAFLTDFFRGIGDRLQVKIKEVNVNISLPPAITSDISPSQGDGVNVLTLHTTEIELQETSASTETSQRASVSSHSGGTSVPEASKKRHVVFKDIWGALLSGTEEPLGGVQEPKTAQNPPEVSLNQGDATALQNNAALPLAGMMNHATPSEAFPSTVELEKSEQTFGKASGSTHPTDLAASVEASTRGSSPRFSDARTQSLCLEDSVLNTQLLTDLDNAILESSGAYNGFGEEEEETPSSRRSSSESYSEHLHSALRSFREERLPLRTSSFLRSRRRMSRSPSQSVAPAFSSAAPSIHALRIPEPPTSSLEHGEQAALSKQVYELKTTKTTGDDPQKAIEASLTESTIFNPAEAESLYMSAIGEARPGSAESTMRRMPGAWNDAADVDAMTDSTTRSKSKPPDLLFTSESGIMVDHLQSQGVAAPATHTLDMPADLAHSSENCHANQGKRPAMQGKQEGNNSTSKGMKISARRIFELDRADMWLSTTCASTKREDTNPSGHFHNMMDSQQAHPHQSVNQPLPGSFSLYAESGTTRPSFTTSAQVGRRSFQGCKDAKDAGSTLLQQYVPVYELLLNILRCRMDVALARIFIELLQGTNSQSYNPSNKPPSVQLSSSVPSASVLQISMTLQTLDIQFVDSVRQEPLHRFETKAYSFPGDTKTSDDTLFVLKAKDLTLCTPTFDAQVAKIELGNFTFGYLDETIISFTKQARMRSSMRDTQAPAVKDVCISIGNRSDGQDVFVTTKPLKLLLNLQKLESVLGSIVGLSGLLDLQSSISSNLTITAPNAKSQQRSRTVRFETSHLQPAERGPSSKSRVNIRIGGLAMSLQGEACTLQYRTSAIKAIARDTIVGVQIDDMRLTGPHDGSMSGEVPLTIRLRDTGLKYLFRPEEPDLTRLISLLTPSKHKFEDDDDFLVDTLIRQRKKGAVLRVNVAKFDVEVEDLDVVRRLEALQEEMSRMSMITKYLPEESRPGLMTLVALDSASFKVDTGYSIGTLTATINSTDVAHIGFPMLVAASLGRISLVREISHILISELLPLNSPGQPPMLMARMIGDELEPTIKVKLWNLCVEYSVPFVLAAFGLDENATQQELDIELASSIAALRNPCVESNASTVRSPTSKSANLDTKPLALDFAFRDCAIGLTPRGIPSKALFVMADARVSGAVPTDAGLYIMVELRKAAILLIDDTNNLQQDAKAVLPERSSSQSYVSHHVDDLCKLGYVSVSAISAATVAIRTTQPTVEKPQTIDIEIKDELFLLETCADSTQTLIETMEGLKPPMPPSKGVKYRTQIAPMQDMMASFSGDAFTISADQATRQADEAGDDQETDFDDLSDVSGIEYNGQPALGHKYSGYPFRSALGVLSTDGLSSRFGDLSTDNDFKGPDSRPVRHLAGYDMIGNKWDSTNNRYARITQQEIVSSPLQVRLRDLHIIWNLHDGYDWGRTRHTITKAVQDIEARAEERRLSRRKPLEDDEEKESLIGDFLFNSIYIGIPINHDPNELTRQINRNMDDLTSETASHTSTVTARPSSSHRTARGQPRRLKLERSKRHKIAFELRGIRADFIGFVAGEETQTSLDIQITDLEIFDHVPTSTWKKFATYMHDAGPRIDGVPMVHLEMCDVRPVPELIATELVIRVNVLPLRLHVDQDALDFITRFFDFKDDSQTLPQPSIEQPYLQRVEVQDVPIKLDYKPKKIDFAGLRSGRTTEFMNFFNLDGADMVLKHTIVYGTSGFAKLHQSLEDVWMPDIRRNQLPSVLSGLNGLRTLVNVGTGMRDLVVIPVREYKKDGRVVRSISKGAAAFAKTTGGELTRFGAKLAVGAQNALQGAEDFFLPPVQEAASSNTDTSGWESGDLDAEERRAISHYANQPVGILQGLKGAARSLERDLLVTKDVIIAISGEARESGTAEGAARAIVRHAPTLILRPMIGASKAISQTLMGATNSVDPENRRRMDDKYKRY